MAYFTDEDAPEGEFRFEFLSDGTLVVDLGDGVLVYFQEISEN